jgi:hypothetical protein
MEAAGRARDRRGRRGHNNINLLLGGDLAHRKRDAGTRDDGDHVDAFGVVGAASDGRSEMGFVLVIGADQLDVLTKHGSPKSSIAIFAASTDHLPAKSA